MHGVDGNYLKMQGELLSRLQVGTLAEQTAQQTRAQAQSVEALRQLREQVQTMAQSDARNKAPLVEEKNEGQFRRFQEGRKRSSEDVRQGTEGGAETAAPESGFLPGNRHVDVRI